MTRTRTLTFLALTVLILGTLAWAASQNAVMYGTVYDASGNPLAGVTVTLQNASLGISRSTTTASDGSYTFSEVPPSSGYRIIALRGGRKVDIRSGITVNVGDERVILPPLTEQIAPAAAPAQEAVEKKVEGQAVQNEAVSTAVSGVITGEQLRTLPLYNRNFLVLGGLTPNVHDSEAHNPLGSASFSISGNRPATNNFLLDGTDNVASSSNQAIPFQVNDAIQEFRVISSTAAAEYGRGAGGVVNVVTGRGGNAFHGNAFGYFGADALNADNPLSVYNGTSFDSAAAYAGPTTAPPLTTPGFGFFAPTNYNSYVATAEDFGYCTDSIATAGATVACNGNLVGVNGANTRFDPTAILAANNEFKQPFDSKQFGVNMGGALIKDKLFLFGSYEGTRIDNPTPIFERVPSLFDRTYNPLLARGMADAQPYLFPDTDLNYSIASQVMSLFPEPNVVGVPDALEFYRGYAPNYTNVHNFIVRSDIVQSENTSWTFRYVLQDLEQLHDASLPEQSQYPGNGAMRDALNQNLSMTLTHSFSPSVINEVRAAFTRFRVNERPQDEGFSLTGVPGPMMSYFLSGLDSQYSGARVASTSGAGLAAGAFQGWGDSVWLVFGTTNPLLPTLDGQFPMARIGAPLGAPGQRRDSTWMIADTVTWSTGKHNFKFGGEWRLLHNRFEDGSFSRGYVVSGNIGEFTSDSATCNEGCNFFGLGQQSFRAPSFDFAIRQHEPYAADLSSYAFSGFVQDTWRIHPRVTLNLGVRYDYFSTPREINGLLWNFDPAANGLVPQDGTEVVDSFGNPCDTTAPYTATYIPWQFLNGWTCSSTGFGRAAAADHNDVAPRAGIAWDLFGSGKTVLRAGIGLFYDQQPASYTAQLMYNRPTPFDEANPQYIYGQYFGGDVLDCTLFGFHCSTGLQVLDPANIDTDPATGNSFFVSAASPMAIYARDVGHSRTPFTRQISASLQQSVTDKLSFEVGYMGTSGRKLPVVFNQGFGNEWFCTNSAPFCDNNSYGPLFQMTNRAGSSYHSLMARVRAADWKGLRMNASYAWAKGIDNASNAIFPLVSNSLFNYAAFLGSGAANPTARCVGIVIGPTVFPGFVPPLDCSTIPVPTLPSVGGAVTTTGERPPITTPYRIGQDWLNFLGDDRGRSDFDVQHRLVLDYTWQVPSLEKAFGAPRWLDGWTLSGVFTAQSGQPFTIFSGPIAGEFEQRVDQSGAVTVTDDPAGAIDATNLSSPGPACDAAGGNPYALPVFGGSLFDGNTGTACIGNSRRNGFTGPRLMTMNFAIQKAFQVFGEGRALTLRTEFYNLFNRANYYNPISTLTTNGAMPNPEFGRIKSAHDPRQIQFAVRFNW